MKSASEHSRKHNPEQTVVFHTDANDSYGVPPTKSINSVTRNLILISLAVNFPDGEHGEHEHENLMVRYNNNDFVHPLTNRLEIPPYDTVTRYSPKASSPVLPNLAQSILDPSCILSSVNRKNDKAIPSTREFLHTVCSGNTSLSCEQSPATFPSFLTGSLSNQFKREAFHSMGSVEVQPDTVNHGYCVTGLARNVIGSEDPTVNTIFDLKRASEDFSPKPILPLYSIHQTKQEKR